MTKMTTNSRKATKTVKSKVSKPLKTKGKVSTKPSKVSTKPSKVSVKVSAIKKTAGKKEKIAKKPKATYVITASALPPKKRSNEDKKSIAKAPFERVVKEVTAKEVKTRTTHRSNRRATAEKPGVRFQKGMMDAIHTASEDMLQGMLGGAAMCAQHRGRKTVTKKDLDFYTSMMMKRGF